MIDVHAHFADEGYSFPEEWEKIQEAGVSRVILASDTIAHAKWHENFARTHEGCYFTVGVHPEFAETPLSEGDIEEIKALAASEKCVAIGEIGLDYHYEGCQAERQRELFVTQLRIANELGLPVEIHSRDALCDTLAILNEFREFLKHGFLMHCYGYGKEELGKFLSLGGYFSFGGVTCFKNARRVQESVIACPMDKILSETDSPYLSPFRGEKNSPANIPVIVEKIAMLKGMDVREAESAIWKNAQKLFPKLS